MTSFGLLKFQRRLKIPTRHAKIFIQGRGEWGGVLKQLTFEERPRVSSCYQIAPDSLFDVRYFVKQ
ncbi:hypothetical protein CEC48_05910 [Pseudomonas sp. K2I15]|nr:hypothetical protein CEC48_05910 [Pseudomonas sp. K2I15]